MFSLVTLPYALAELAPVISPETLSFHHGKHLQAYVDNLNKLIAGTEYELLSLEEIVTATAFRAPAGPLTAIFNNAGQILNHNLYFTQFRPSALRQAQGPTSVSAGEPVEPPKHPHSGLDLFKQIEKQWGTLEAFKQEFVAKGVGLFGSGWVWLSAKPDGSLVITQEPGASNPVTKGLKPLLTFDVWEHAYYLDYQNRRAAHLDALWGIVDWKVVEERYTK